MAFNLLQRSAQNIAGPKETSRGLVHTRIAEDGRRLAASWFEPRTAARAVAVVSAATDVPRGFYAGFAQSLVSRGYAVLTDDYRGIADSREVRLRDERATMRDWAVLDMSAALAAAESRRAGRGLPLLLVGHSFAGNSIAFARGVERADAILGVASQLGEPRLFPGVHGVAAELFFRAWMPAVVAVFGHLPGWALAPGAQALPAGVARQWGQWGSLRGWAFADPAMAAHRAGQVCRRLRRQRFTPAARQALGHERQAALDAHGVRPSRGMSRAGTAHGLHWRKGRTVVDATRQRVPGERALRRIRTDAPAPPLNIS